MSRSITVAKQSEPDVQYSFKLVIDIWFQDYYNINNVIGNVPFRI